MLPPKPSHTIRIRTTSGNRFAEIEWTLWKDCREEYNQEGMAIVELRIAHNIVMKQLTPTGGNIGSNSTAIFETEWGIERMAQEIMGNEDKLYIECLKVRVPQPMEVDDEEEDYETEENIFRSIQRFNNDDDGFYQLPAKYITHDNTTGVITVLVEDNTPTAGDTRIGDEQYLINRMRAISREKEDWEIPT